MKGLHKYFKLGRLQIEITLYGNRKEPCKFKVGDEVKCLFNDSGHKFWNQLSGKLIIKKIKYSYRASMYELMFTTTEKMFERKEDVYFYENDFRKV